MYPKKTDNTMNYAKKAMIIKGFIVPLRLSLDVVI